MYIIGMLTEVVLILLPQNLLCGYLFSVVNVYTLSILNLIHSSFMYNVSLSILKAEIRIPAARPNAYRYARYNTVLHVLFFGKVLLIDEFKD